MLDFKELFDTYFFKEIGLHRLDDSRLRLIENLHGSLKEKTSHYLKSVNSAGLKFDRVPPKIYFDYLASAELNAVAAKYSSDIYFIGLYHGTLMIISDLFFNLLSRPNVLTHIGDPGKEVENIASYPFHITDYTTLLFEMGGRQSTIPNCPVRRLYAYHLTYMACDFVIYHELGHILYGHVDYVKKLTSCSSLTEQATPDGKIEILIRQILEADADISSVNQGVASMLGHFKDRDNLPDGYKPFFITFEDSLVNWSLAVFFVLRILGPQNYEPEEFLNAIHPPARVRQALIMEMTEISVKKKYPEFDTRSVKESVNKALVFCEESYSTVTNTNFKGFGLKEAMSREGWAHRRLLADNWPHVRELLQKYNYDNLYN